MALLLYIYIYNTHIYIYIERERERENNTLLRAIPTFKWDTGAESVGYIGGTTGGSLGILGLNLSGIKGGRLEGVSGYWG